MLDFESELASIALTRINEHREQSISDALELLKAEGYRISKPKAPKKPKAEAPKLNAVGKPYSPSYDPNYKMKYKPSNKIPHIPADPCTQRQEYNAWRERRDAANNQQLAA